MKTEDLTLEISEELLSLANRLSKQLDMNTMGDSLNALCLTIAMGAPVLVTDQVTDGEFLDLVKKQVAVFLVMVRVGLIKQATLQ